MQNVGNELRSIAMTKVAQAYLCHRIKDTVIKLSDSPPLDPLLQDLWHILLTPKIFIREGARELNIRLDGDIPLSPSYFHHTRRYGYLTAYESLLFSSKVETYLQIELYGEIAKKPQRSAARVIESWSDRLDLDPSWPEKTIRTYRNHLKGQYPGLVA